MRAGLILALLVVASYGGSLRNELVFDDLYLLRNDRRVRDWRAAADLFTGPLWGHRPEPGRWEIHHYYRPLQVLPLTVSYFFFGDAAWPSHLLSILFHLANALLVHFVFRRIVHDDPAALLAASLFAVYPAYSEAVLWASDIAGLGAALCALSILALHVAGAQGAPRCRAALSAPLLLLGLWFKESAVLAPALLLAHDLLIAPARGMAALRRNGATYLAFVAPLAVYLGLRRYALGGLLPGMELNPLSRVQLAINAVALLPDYAVNFLSPFSLLMYHDFDPASGFADPRFLAGGAIAAGALLAIVRTARRHPAVAFGIVWSAITTLPHLLVRWPRLNVFAERYLYMPSIGLFLVLLYGALRLRSPALRRALAAATGVLCIACVVRDVLRAPDWHDEVTLYEKTLRQSRRAELIRGNLSLAYLERRRYEDGLRVARELIAIDPDWQDAWHNLGLLLLARGDEAEALAAFEESRRRQPGKAETLLNLGYLYDRAGRRGAALDAYFRLVALEPKSAPGWFNLAVIALEQGQLGNARAALQRALTADPGDREARTLLGRVEAGGSARSADPARTLESCERAKRLAEEGRTEDAVIALRSAAWLDERSPLPHQYLANVYFLSGRIRKAVEAQREALARDPGNDLYRHNLDSLEHLLGEGE